MRLCLFQPDMPQNTGAAVRVTAGLDVALDIIGPCGFPLDDTRLRRVAMDYHSQAAIKLHDSWLDFLNWRQAEQPSSRLILMTTKASQPFYDFDFQPEDILIAGSESSGAPDYVHETVDARLFVPLKTRSLNVIVASSMILGEALRQTHLYPINQKKGVSP